MRALAAFLIVVLLAGCAGTASPSASPSIEPLPTAGTPSPSPTATPDEPAATPDEPETTETPAPDPLPEGDEVAAGLAFVAQTGDESGTTQIFVVDPDGTIRQLTGLSGGSPGGSGPVWSPDGTQLVFGPPKLGAPPEHQIFIINADGSGERALAPLDEEFTIPFAWSPKVAYVAYGSIDAAEGPSLWVVDVNTGERTYLGVGVIPRWLPDEVGISFVRGEEGRDPDHPTALTQVAYVMALDGSPPQELAEATDALWAPDGSAVLLPDEQEGTISVADADGANLESFLDGFGPSWSPDSTRIAYVSGRDDEGMPILTLVDREGQVIWDGVVGQSASWSPDGTRIAVEIPTLEPMIQVLDAATGEVLWERAGSQPDWGG